MCVLFLEWNEKTEPKSSTQRASYAHRCLDGLNIFWTSNALYKSDVWNLLHQRKTDSNIGIFWSMANRIFDCCSSNSVDFICACMAHIGHVQQQFYTCCVFVLPLEWNTCMQLSFVCSYIFVYWAVFALVILKIIFVASKNSCNNIYSSSLFRPPSLLPPLKFICVHLVWQSMADTENGLKRKYITE